MMPPFSPARERPELGIKLWGTEFPNPIGLAAGMDKDAVAIRGWETLGFGFAELGTITPRPQAGNDAPRVWRVPERRALINRLGFPSEGMDSGRAANRADAQGRDFDSAGAQLRAEQQHAARGGCGRLHRPDGRARAAGRFHRNQCELAEYARAAQLAIAGEDERAVRGDARRGRRVAAAGAGENLARPRTQRAVSDLRDRARAGRGRDRRVQHFGRARGAGRLVAASGRTQRPSADDSRARADSRYPYAHPREDPDRRRRRRRHGRGCVVAHSRGRVAGGALHRRSSTRARAWWRESKRDWRTCSGAMDFVLLAKRSESTGRRRRFGSRRRKVDCRCEVAAGASRGRAI